MPLIPILAALIPSLVKVTEGLFQGQEKSGEEKKQFVTTILENLFDKFLKDKIPDFPGIDERAVFCSTVSTMIDAAVEKYLK